MSHCHKGVRRPISAPMMKGATNTDCAFSDIARPHQISERADWPRIIAATANTQAPAHRASHCARRAALITAGGMINSSTAWRDRPPIVRTRSATARAAKAVPATDRILIR